MTDQEGFRVAATDEESKLFADDTTKRVLILGDSFAEGEGVDAEKRFDYLMQMQQPSWSIRAVGCGGYGTDQQLILLKRLITQLKPGDVVVLLTCSNDFSDILRKSHSHRAKPWCQIVDGKLVTHAPKSGIQYRLRDRSYLLGFLMGRFGAEEAPSVDDVKHKAPRLYQAIVDQMSTTIGDDLHFCIAYHSGNGRGFPDDGHVFFELRQQGFATCDLDSLVGTRRSTPIHFLPCGHWTAHGNAAVANALLRFLNRNLHEATHSIIDTAK